STFEITYKTSKIDPSIRDRIKDEDELEEYSSLHKTDKGFKVVKSIELINLYKEHNSILQLPST
ncbi:hypothetical protein ABMA71_15900, partial [Halobacteriovorax sp. ZH3_bin.1]